MAAKMISTRVNGHFVAGMQSITTGEWEVEIDANIPVMEREFELRSTYAGMDLRTVLTAAIWTVWEFHGIAADIG